MSKKHRMTLEEVKKEIAADRLEYERLEEMRNKARMIESSFDFPELPIDALLEGINRLEQGQVSILKMLSSNGPEIRAMRNEEATAHKAILSKLDDIDKRLRNLENQHNSI